MGEFGPRPPEEELQKGLLQRLSKKIGRFAAPLMAAGSLAASETAEAADKVPHGVRAEQIRVIDYKKDHLAHDPVFDGVGETNETGEHPSVDLRKAEAGERPNKENEKDEVAKN